MPMVGIPVFEDQDENLLRVETRKFGVSIQLEQMKAETLALKMKQVMEDKWCAALGACGSLMLDGGVSHDGHHVGLIAVKAETSRTQNNMGVLLYVSTFSTNHGSLHAGINLNFSSRPSWTVARPGQQFSLKGSFLCYGRKCVCACVCDTRSLRILRPLELTTPLCLC